MTIIFKIKNSLNGFDSNIISSEEAKEWNVNIDDAEIASINDCINEANENDDSAFIGSIQVIEGLYKFDFDKGFYVKIEEETR
jgi:hypothetical protein